HRHPSSSNPNRTESARPCPQPVPPLRERCETGDSGPISRRYPMSAVAMTVNGKPVTGDLDPRTLLVQFLRETLRLTGTHVGCDTSQCGACVVHVNGKAIKSCTALAVACDGADVTTVEGLAKNGKLHPMQEAFREHHGLQCGFCTPGMLMAAVDLVKRKEHTHAYYVRSPHAHAAVKSSKVPKWKPEDGVVAVLTGEHVAEDKIGGLICGWMIHSKDGSPMKAGPHPILAQGKVRYVG